MLNIVLESFLGDFSNIETWMIFVWLAIFIVSVIVEFSTSELVSIWFALASLVALILSVIPGIPYWIEIIVFVFCSIILMIALRPLAKKYLERNTLKTNSDDLIGRKALVTKEITEFDKGEVKLSGLTWTAESSDPKVGINKGSVVTVVAIEGNKLIVKLSKEDN